MAYGTIKVDQVTFTNGGVDQTISVSGIVQSISGDITATGTIQGATIIGTSTVSGATVTGDAGQFITATITSGVFASGTAAAPSVSIGTTDNGLYSPGADQLAISTNGTGRLFVDANGKLGLGTSSPQSFATFNGGTSAGFTDVLQLSAGATSADSGPGLTFNFNYGDYDSWKGWQLGVIRAGAQNPAGGYAGYLSFYTNTGGSLTEKLRITSDGKLGLGTSTPGSYAANFAVVDSGNSAISIAAGTTSYSSLYFADGTSGTQTYAGFVQYSHADDKLYIGSGANNTITCDSSQRVGIGTTSPTSLGTNITTVEIKGGTATRSGGIRLSTSDDSQKGAFYVYDGEAILGTETAHPLGLYVNNTERARIDSSGRLLVGTSSARSVGGGTGSLIYENINEGRPVSFVTNTNTIYGQGLAFGKSRGTSLGSATIVQSGDTLGYLDFCGADGTDLNSVAAGISAQVDGTPGFNDMPGRLVFSTTADGSASPTERMRITNAGNVGIGTTSPSAKLHAIGDVMVQGEGGLGEQSIFIGKSATSLPNSRGVAIAASQDSLANHDLVLKTSTGSSGLLERLRIDSSGRLLVGTSSARVTDGTDERTLQIEDTGNYGISVIKNSNNTFGAIITLAKSRGTAIGSNIIVQNGDILGQIQFLGADGNDLNSIGARINAEVDGTPGNNDLPGRLVFSTTADGASSPTERMRIDSSGRVGIGLATLVGGTGDVSIVRNSAIRWADSDGTQRVDIYGDSSSNFVVRNGTGSTERARIDSSGRLLVGTSSAPTGSNTQYTKLGAFGNSSNNTASFLSVSYGSLATSLSSGIGIGRIFFGDTAAAEFASISAETDGSTGSGDYPGRLVFSTTADGASSPTERMRIDNNGNVYFGKTTSATATVGIAFQPSVGYGSFTRGSGASLAVNRQTDDGDLVQFLQADNLEGSISVSGSTVSLNGAHLSRWSQLPGGAERNEILRGTVLSNIDEMCAWGDEDNEQLNRMKVSDVEGDPNVSGVFQAWDDDDDTYTDDFYCAMTGDFIIRIAQGVTVQRGDLLMSAGDGTAKPQDDDIIRSKTVAKVTSTHVTCTYDDGSYCVPCVLMAC
jgi:hypothetical protein